MILLFWQEAFTKRYIIEDYKSLSIYLMSKETFDTVWIRESFVNFPIIEFLKNNPKKVEIKKLIVNGFNDKNISDELQGYDNLLGLELTGYNSTVDVIPFFSTIPNLQTMVLKIGSLYSDFFEECAKLKNLKYLSAGWMRDTILPKEGFECLIFFYVSGYFTTISPYIANYPKIKFIYLGDNIREIDTLVLNMMDNKDIMEMFIDGIDIPKEFLSYAKKRYKRIYIDSKKSNMPNPNIQKIRFPRLNYFWLRTKYKVRKIFVPCDYCN
jgi:hypothetical protein